VDEFTKMMKERFEEIETGIGGDPIELTTRIGTLADLK